MNTQNRTHGRSSFSCSASYSSILGSFKVKGLANQVANLPEKVKNGEKEMITMSAGNYGKAMCYAAHELGIKARVMTPDSAPMDRTLIMEVGLSFCIWSWYVHLRQ